MLEKHPQNCRAPQFTKDRRRPFCSPTVQKGAKQGLHRRILAAHQTPSPEIARGNRRRSPLPETRYDFAIPCFDERNTLSVRCPPSMTCDRYFASDSWRDTPRARDGRSFRSRDLVDAHATAMNFAGRRHFSANRGRRRFLDFFRRFSC